MADADDYPILDSLPAPSADDYPILDPSEVHANNVPRPPGPEDEYPILDQSESPGFVARIAEGWKQGFGEQPLGISPENQLKSPMWQPWQPLIAGADALMRAFPGVGGAISGAVAAGTEIPVTGYPAASKTEADKLQREGVNLTNFLLTGQAGVHPPAIGSKRPVDLTRQGQTPGAKAAPGVAQEPNPPARSAVADFQNKATLGDGTMEKGGENLNTRDYGKTTPAATGEASGVNVLKDGVDPTVASTFKPEAPPAVEPPAAAPRPPPEAPPAPQNVGEQLRAQQAARVEAQAMPQGMGLLPQHEPIYRAAQRAAPELPPESLAQIARMASGPKQAAIMAERAVNRIAERRAAPEPVMPEGTMELPPVEVRPAEAAAARDAAQRKFEEDTLRQEAAARVTPKAAIEQRAPGETVGDALKQQKMTKAERQKFNFEVKQAEKLRLYNGIQPKDPAIAAEIAKRDAAREARIGARTEKVQTEVQAEQTAAQFAPATEKPPLYPHASLSKPKLEKAYEKALDENSKITDEMVAAGRGHEKPNDILKQTDELSQRYAKSSEQVRSLAEEMDRRKTWGGTLKPIPEAHRNTFYAAKKGQQFAPQELPSGTAPPRITPEARPIEPTGRPVPEGARAEINTRLDQTMSAENPAAHLRETAARARELGLEGQARRIEAAAAEMERQRDVQIAPGPGERSTGLLRQQEGMTPEQMQTRIRQLEYDRNLARKRGEDVTGENYAGVRNDLQRLRDGLKQLLADEHGGGKLPAPVERAAEGLRQAYNSFLDFGDKAINEIQMLTAPMAARSGSARARVIAKDQANAIRRIDKQWQIEHDHITKNFDKESIKRMWEAADEENVMRQKGEQDSTRGIAALNPKERALVESFQPRARELWEMAQDIGWAKGEGLPYYTPRMFTGLMEKVEGAAALDAKSGNIRTTTPGMKQRKYLTTEESEAAAQKHFGDEATVIRDIRTMPMALAKMEKALVNRVMIKKIEDIGRKIGKETVVESTTSPGPGWFTIPDNPAFYTFRPRYEIADTATYRAAAEARSGVAVPEGRVPLMDRNGNPVIDRVPIWIPNEFKGPLKSIFNVPSPYMIERGLMRLKGMTTSLIMNSPMIHNMVEWGRALPTMPGKMLTLQTYFEGNAAKRGVPYNGTVRYVRDWASGKLEAAPRNASPVVIEALDRGLVPIGKRFFNQDITAVMENPDLAPGRSVTAKMLAVVPDLFNPKAGDAVRRAVDRAGDVWHNAMLWDRISDLQMGLYVNAKNDLIAKHPNMNPIMAEYTAAHIANRYAGALPNEAMSNGARRLANFMMFSRTFTLGNLGVLKDMFTGLPKDVLAQIMRDIGTIDPRAVDYVKQIARRKAMMAVATDVGLMYIGNSILQSVFNVINSDENLEKALGTEGAGYVRRFNDAMQNYKENPLSVLTPLTFVGGAAGAAVGGIPGAIVGGLGGTAMAQLQRLSATYENEPGKQDRIKTGETKEGRGVYMRNLTGKIGEEFVGYTSGPIDMAKRKEGTIARPLSQIIANDKGFGQKIYDPHADMLSGKQIESAINIAKVLIAAQTPEGQIKATKDLLMGEGNRNVNLLQTLGPFGGLTFSQGHPGGPAAGELARFHETRQFELRPELTEIRKLVRDGKTDEAIERMNKLELDAGTRRSILNPHMPLRNIRELYRHGDPEQVKRFELKRE